MLGLDAPEGWECCCTVCERDAPAELYLLFRNTVKTSAIATGVHRNATVLFGASVIPLGFSLHRVHSTI